MPSPLLRLLSIFVPVLLGALCGCAGTATKLALPGATAADYDLSLSDFHAAEGYTLTYAVTPTALSVTLSDDFGHPPKVVWKADLTADQSRKFSAFAGNIPVDELKADYEPAGTVFDGYQYTYNLRIGRRPAKQVVVNNVSQPQLDPLIDLINGVVPEQFRAASPRASVSAPPNR